MFNPTYYSTEDKRPAIERVADGLESEIGQLAQALAIQIAVVRGFKRGEFEETSLHDLGRQVAEEATDLAIGMVRGFIVERKRIQAAAKELAPELGL